MVIAPEDLPPGLTEKAVRRAKIHVLDACIKALEDAHERGEERVTVPLARKLRAYVKSISPGIPIHDALKLAFDAQDPLLGVRAHYRDSSRPIAELTELEARNLTNLIKEGVRNVSLLLFRAHGGRAWAALGYSSWASYIRTEFGISRSRSYELVDHGRVLTAVMVSAGMSALPTISPYAARQLKHSLPELAVAIRTRVENAASPAEAAGIVVEMVASARNSGDARHSGVSANSSAVESNATSINRPFADSNPPARQVADILEAIRLLGELPSPHQVVRSMSVERLPSVEKIELIASWLRELALRCQEATFERAGRF